jgi:hypothetical protein
MTRQQQINAALKLLKPPADKEDQCHAHIVEWLTYVDAARQAAGTTRKEMRKYSAALARFCKISRKHKGVRLVGQELLDRAVVIDKKMSPSWTRPSPRHFAVSGAYELLQCWGHNPTTTKDGEWDKLAAILFGKRGTLHRQILKVHAQQAEMRQ